MDRNTFLAFVLSMAVFTAWLAYQETRPRPSTPEAPLTVDEDAAADRSPASPLTAQRIPDASPMSPQPATVASAETHPERRIEFASELYSITLTNRGAAVVSWVLNQYEADQRPIELLRVDDATAGVILTPFHGLGLGDLSRAVYDVEQESEDGVHFTLRRGGFTIRKVYRFDPESYGFRFEVSLENASGGAVRTHFSVLWPAMVSKGEDFRELSFAALVDGEVESVAVPQVGSPGFFDRMFSGGEEPEVLSNIGWAGINTRYFLGALVPDRAQSARVNFEPLVAGRSGQTHLSFDYVDLPDGQSLTHIFQGFVGPKVPQLLDAQGAELSRSINFGWSWVTPLTRFFSWLLHATYAVVQNYGVAIILITILVRGVTAPIMAGQMRSMERMRELQPRMKEIQEKHKDDRQKQSEETMRMYKETGVNPLGGCLPLFLQFPVFIGLFYALQSSIDLRQAPFVGWISDLSAPETLFSIPGVEIPIRILPLAMGASMVIQQKMTPTTMDPAQAKMMLIVMPIMMTVLFYQFPSGLVLYWFVSNLLGIGQQYWIRTRMKK